MSASSAHSKLLAGRVVFITGAGGGLGRSTAMAVAAAGARVAVTARRLATAEQTVAAIRAEGGEGLALEADVARRADVDRAVAATVAQYGGLDVMIHNASSNQSGHPAALETLDEAVWDEQVAVSLAGGYHCAQAAFPFLCRSGHGRYIGMTSAFGLHGAGMNPAYAAIKAGIRGFVKALAREWGPYGITTLAVAPAAITEAAAAYFEQNPSLHEAFLKGFPLRRMGQPRADIGGAIVAICSSNFDYVSGQTLPVDGGLYTGL